MNLLNGLLCPLIGPKFYRDFLTTEQLFIVQGSSMAFNGWTEVSLNMSRTQKIDRHEILMLCLFSTYHQGKPKHL